MYAFTERDDIRTVHAQKKLLYTLSTLNSIYKKDTFRQIHTNHHEAHSDPYFHVDYVFFFIFICVCRFLYTVYALILNAF